MLSPLFFIDSITISSFDLKDNEHFSKASPFYLTASIATS